MKLSELLTYGLVLFVLIFVVVSIVKAQDYNPGTYYDRGGDTYGSSTILRRGDTYHQGTVRGYQRGTDVYRSDGLVERYRGDTMHRSDGLKAYKRGDTTHYSNGTKCYRRGKTLHCF